MEELDCSYLMTAPQSHQCMSYSASNDILPKDGLGIMPSLDGVDDSTFALGSYAFDPFNAIDPSALRPRLRHSSSVSPPPQQVPPSQSGSVDSGIALDLDHERSRTNSSEDKENLTPAQSRRKAQNRAAQRAFRERKERHVRDLEARLTLLTTTISSLQSDNAHLKLLLQQVQTENETLRASGAPSPSYLPAPAFANDASFLSRPRQLKTSSSTEELKLKQTKLAHQILATGPRSAHFSASPGSESHLLPASRTWDLLQSYPLYLSGTLDIGEVFVRLKNAARCKGMLPLFDADEIRRVIEEVGSNGAGEAV